MLRCGFQNGGLKSNRYKSLLLVLSYIKYHVYPHWQVYITHISGIWTTGHDLHYIIVIEYAQGLLLKYNP